MFLVHRVPRLHEHLPAHPQVGEHGGTVGQVEPQVLAPAPRGRDLGTGEPTDEVGLTGHMTPDRPRVQDLDRGHRAPDHMGFEAGSDDLDLG